MMTWEVWIEDETGAQEMVAEGFATQEAAAAYAREIEARETFWAEARRAA